MKKDHSELVIVYRAPHMIAANMVHGLLQNNSIPNVVRSLQIPMYDDIALMHSQVWGHILVPKQFEAQAKRIIAQYLESIEESP